MLTRYRWVVACRAGDDKPWHIGFSSSLYLTYASAARMAFIYNEDSGGYQHKPVRVRVEVVDNEI